MVTGHGKTGAYLHRFKILENANRPCGDGDQTVKNLLNRCSILNTQRERFKQNVLNTEIWPPKKQELISKHLNSWYTGIIKNISLNTTIYLDVKKEKHNYMFRHVAIFRLDPFGFSERKMLLGTFC
jgi:hypothetical protein